MASTVRESDLRGVLDVLAAAVDSPVPRSGMPEAVLEQLAALVRCDMLCFSEFDPAARRSYVDHEWTDEGLTEDPAAAEDSDIFFKYYWESLSCSYPTRTGDERSVTMQSDFYSTREWHNTPMYADYFLAPGFPFDHEMMVCLPAPGTRTRRLLFFRLPGRDFDERDRLTLALLRPHLAEVHHELERSRSAEPQLTARQRQLLGLVAAGHTNAQIASALFVSVHTVRTHLENIFERLQVSSRAAAVARAFPNGLTGD